MVAEPFAVEKHLKPVKRKQSGRLVRVILFAILAIALLTCAIVFRKSQQAKAQERVRAGHIYRRSGQKEKAISAYKEALRFDRGNADIWKDLGSAYQVSGDLPEEIKAYEKAAALAPRGAGIQESLGNALDRAGMRNDAQMAYSKALSLYSAQIAANAAYGFLYKGIGDLEQRLGDPEEAAAAYESAATYYLKKNDPGDWFEWEFLGDAWVKLGRPEDAILAYERRVSAKPASSDAMQMKLRKLKNSRQSQAR
jgi:tetratricopeptide (TPR) repeat protein